MQSPPAGSSGHLSLSFSRSFPFPKQPSVTTYNIMFEFIAYYYVAFQLINNKTWYYFQSKLAKKMKWVFAVCGGLGGGGENVSQEV